MDCCLRVIKCAIGSIPFLFNATLGFSLFSSPLVCTVCIRHHSCDSCMFLKIIVQFGHFSPLGDKSLSAMGFRDPVLLPADFSSIFSPCRLLFYAQKKKRTAAWQSSQRSGKTKQPSLSIQFQTAGDPGRHAEGPHPDTVPAASVRAA